MKIKSDFMPLLEEGRVCVKKFGRDAGDKAVITKVVDKNFVMIKSHSRPKERKCNIKHLEFLNQKISAGNESEIASLLNVEKKQDRTPKQAPKQGKK
ncbi:MAG: 50S ribosomal protein L14e [Candidatus Marsarchaeota archaeon]|jgi:ribosomal protein L14E/L6E/L27E|nr:50S ribosomal protein L14e [Candidatus Marsarchaeota archaeon]